MNPRPQTQRQPGRMALSSVLKGKQIRPIRVLLYGTEGVGKSTWASQTPSPIFLAAEDGISNLDVARFPEPRTWMEVLEAIQSLVIESHELKTLVLDTLDWLEPLCWAHVCQQADKSSIEDFGFGKGYVAALDQWRILLAALDGLRTSRGMHVIMLGHSAIKPFQNPEGAAFDRYELKLHKGAAGLLKEWADAVLFASYETFTVKDKDGPKAKGVANGARIVRTERRAAFDAKNRQGLPFQMPLSWEDFWQAAQKGQDPVQLATQARELAKGTDLEAKVEEYVQANATDAAKLAALVDRIRGKLNGGE